MWVKLFITLQRSSVNSSCILPTPRVSEIRVFRKGNEFNSKKKRCVFCSITYSCPCGRHKVSHSSFRSTAIVKYENFIFEVFKIGQELSWRTCDVTRLSRWRVPQVPAGEVSTPEQPTIQTYIQTKLYKAQYFLTMCRYLVWQNHSKHISVSPANGQIQFYDNIDFR